MASLIEQRLKLFDRESFRADRNEIDLTAFRLQVIGEAVRKLGSQLKAGHPEIPWQSIVSMRNFIAHDYEGIEIDRVWGVATRNLSVLAEICIQHLGVEGTHDL